MNLKNTALTFSALTFSALIALCTGCATTEAPKTVRDFLSEPLPAVVDSDIVVPGNIGGLTEAQRAVVEEFGASHELRSYYYLWTSIRSAWPDLLQGQRQLIRDMDPAWAYPAFNGTASREVAVGEEFLQFHLALLEKLNRRLAAKGIPEIAPLAVLPRTDDLDFPVGTQSSGPKSDELYAVVKQMERRFLDAGFLKLNKLGQVGFQIERSVLPVLKMRWASGPVIIERPPVSLLSPQPVDGWVWRDPSYHYMGDAYGATASPFFWQLISWVKARTDGWLAANGFSVAAESCSGKARCYEWKRVWDGAGIEGTRSFVLKKGRSLDSGEIGVLETILSGHARVAELTADRFVDVAQGYESSSPL